MTRQWAGLVAVSVSILVLLLVPQEFFLAATFGSTLTMLGASRLAGGLRTRARVRVRHLIIGLVSAGALYAIFFAGAFAIREFRPFGIDQAAESGIYSLIASPSNPLTLQLAALFVDAAGFESYFRGVVQKKLEPRLGVLAIPAAALLDASLHLAAFYRYGGAASLWAATTFVADAGWGLTFYFSKSTFASFTSHLTWDVVIFILEPIM
ncbi:MAG: CPBP family intramembrane metalloprotease [Thaumarchaeota archaeon]|nr:CPBP family intramembrane metalloprotease [Nitrososphaerota archaeon]